jgi:hypothetical protein
MFYCIFINGLYHAGLTIGPSRTWLNRSCRAWLNGSEARHTHDLMRASCSCRTNFTVLQAGPFNPTQMARYTSIIQFGFRFLPPGSHELGPAADAFPTFRLVVEPSGGALSSIDLGAAPA